MLQRNRSGAGRSSPPVELRAGGAFSMDVQVPAVMPAGILGLEFLVHAWDFAIATGREVVVSEPVSEYVLGVAGKVITQSGPPQSSIG